MLARKRRAIEAPPAPLVTTAFPLYEPGTPLNVYGKLDYFGQQLLGETDAFDKLIEAARVMATARSADIARYLAQMTRWLDESARNSASMDAKRSSGRGPRPRSKARRSFLGTPFGIGARLPLFQRGHQLIEGFPSKRTLAVKSFVKRHAEAELVRSVVYGLPRQLLRRHVRGRSHELSGPGHRRRKDAGIRDVVHLSQRHPAVRSCQSEI